MPAEPTARDAASAVAAVLAVTPIHPDRGQVITGYENAIGAGVDYWRRVWGDPTPIAARQAVAVLRWLATNAPEHDYSEFIEYAWTSAELDALADAIDGGPADGGQ